MKTNAKDWRRGWESNPRIKVLQTSPLPIGYRASSLTVYRNFSRLQPPAPECIWRSRPWIRQCAGLIMVPPRMTTFGPRTRARSLAPLFLYAIALPVYGQSGPGYVGARVCANCHSDATRKWATSLHSKVMQHATERSVEGDFAQGKAELGGSIYLLQHRNGNYYITESYLTGKPWEHHVDYTLGSRRVQEYLSTLPGGRIIVLPTAWDNIQKLWRYEPEVGNQEDDRGVPVQLWNKTCYSCHVSREQKNFNLQDLGYQTIWLDLGVDCETCHGPGSEHVAKARAAKPANPASRTAVSKAIENP